MNAVLHTEEKSVRPKPVSVEREYITPEVNIFETSEGFVLKADMPGVTKEGLEITLEGNALTIVGRREHEFEIPNADLLYRESRPANFRRTFELDHTIDYGKISAKMDQGVLGLTLPKTEKIKPRKITVGE